MKASIPIIYKKIEEHDPKKLALVCTHMDSWKEKEDGKDVTRRNLVGRASILDAKLTEMGIRCLPICRDSLDESREELFEADMCVVAGELFYQTLRAAIDVRKLGYDKPIYIEIMEEEASKSKNIRIATNIAIDRNAIDLLYNFVYLLKTRKRPHEIEFDVDETNLKKVQSVVKPDKSDTPIIEGRIYGVTLTKYERKPKARKQCLNHYGYTCTVCRFNFEQQYGVAGRGLIHVHHLDPVSMCNGEREVDPIKDLCPVCPNCHMVIHSRKPIYSIDEMKILIEKRPH